MENSTLRLLAKSYPTIREAAAEAINLSAITKLPKGTEYFFSDLHGEHEAFIHMLKSASGNIKNKIDLLYANTIPEKTREELAELIYYPEEVLKRKEIEKEKMPEEYHDWYKITIFQLIEVLKTVSRKYTRSKVRKSTPSEFVYVIDELLHADSEDKTNYYTAIIESVMATGMSDQFIIAICGMIRKNAIDSLHIIGDIYDRGPRADLIMDELMKYDDIDIEWGNHDIEWIGAACGNEVSIANALAANIKYNSFDFLEDGYGINLRALSTFAGEVYKEDPCEIFKVKQYDMNKYDPIDVELAAKMHKAMVVILFKLEGALYKRHPEYGMEDRIMLEHIDYTKGTVEIDGKDYPLRDSNFPTVDQKNPLKLTREEKDLMETLAASFRHSEKLQKHIHFMFSKGGMYKCINNNLLYHGCVPFDENGEFLKVELSGKVYSGRAYLDKINDIVKQAMFGSHHFNKPSVARDYLWYLWCGKNSPIFGKSKMTHFEQYFVEDPKVKVEERNPYYDLINKPEICEKILEEFGLDPSRGHIVNGHVPVKIGENPVKGNGKAFIIDGGISKAYRSTTGIGGYTLLYSSQESDIVEHQPFKGKGQISGAKVHVVEKMPQRMLVGDTDKGAELKEDIRLLKELIKKYRTGAIKEKE